MINNKALALQHAVDMQSRQDLRELQRQVWDQQKTTSSILEANAKQLQQLLRFEKNQAYAVEDQLRRNMSDLLEQEYPDLAVVERDCRVMYGESKKEALVEWDGTYAVSDISRPQSQYTLAVLEAKSNVGVKFYEATDKPKIDDKLTLSEKIRRTIKCIEFAHRPDLKPEQLGKTQKKQVSQLRGASKDNLIVILGLNHQPDLDVFERLCKGQRQYFQDACQLSFKVVATNYKFCLLLHSIDEP